MIYITTSRKPIQNSRTFAKQFGEIIGANYLTRGKSSISDLISNARYNGAKRVYVVTDYAGNVSQLIEITVGPKNWEFTDTYNIKVLKLRRDEDIKRISRNIQIKVESRPMIHLIRSLDMHSSEDSEYSLIEKNGVVSVYHNGADVGPSFKIDYTKV